MKCLIDLKNTIKIMKKRVTKLTESDLNRIVGKIVSEQIKTKVDPLYKPTWVGGTEGHRGPGPGGMDERTKSYTVTMDGSLFKNGEDKIDTNSSAFNKGMTAIQDSLLKSALGGTPPSIQIIGGASAVGEKQGYDNKGLAQRRANNFYNIIKTKFPNVNFTVGQPVVGTATEKNSAAANAEQFVKLVVSGSKTDLNTRQAIDHTAVNLNIGPNKIKQQVPIEKTYIVCFEFTESELSRIKSSKMGSKIISTKKK
jgi:hypothetical protein